MSFAVFDASVAVKWLITDDTLAPAALAARSEFEAAAPALIQVEVANALWKYVRLGAVPIEEAVEGAAVLRDIMSLTEDRELLGAAQRLAADLGHPVYDCLYLALAQRLGSALVTADRRLAGRSRELGIDTRFIESET